MKKPSKLRQFATRGIVGCLALFGAMTGAAAADFSFTGSLFVGRQVQFFDITVAAGQAVTMRTYQYGGGTNAVGAVIPAGGFDSQLFVFDSTTGNLVASNDDLAGIPGNDSGFNSLALPAGNYRVALTKYNNDPADPNLSAGFDNNTSNGFSPTTKNYALDIRNVSSATVAPPITQANLTCLYNTIAGLPANQVFGQPQRFILLDLVRNVASRYLGTVYNDLSFTSVRQVVTRANGCGERGSPDVILPSGGAASSSGAELDLITTCPAQDAVLSCLRTPTPAVAPPPRPPVL